MKKLIFIFCLLSSVSIFSQNLSDEYFSPFRANSWIFGIAGNISFDNHNAVFSLSNQNAKMDISGYTFNLNARNGRMITNNLAVGVDLQWSNKNNKQVPNPNQNNFEISDVELMGFIGIFGRYYVPISNERAAIFGELSLGYLSYRDENVRKSDTFRDGITSDADGLGYNVGLGASLFATKHIAFELTARYEMGKLTGKSKTSGEDQDIEFEINHSRINLLLGIQLYL
jgi:opacity protein-like surface antigen